MSGDYIHLTGAEDVLRAGRVMAEAAESMRRAAMEITQAVDRVVATLDEHRQWAEAIGAGACAVVNRAEVDELTKKLEQARFDRGMSMQRRREAESEAERLRKALDGSEGELATLKNAAMGMGWTGDGSVSEFYAEWIDEMESGLARWRKGTESEE
jgi:hypothetical protein